ncbi:MAG TPA: FtsH protease activity modulator HflK [Burkholderiaceae bacterium]|nr:FtsH protease activity modulator HflK [Burkholderiaceae bacterium]
MHSQPRAIRLISTSWLRRISGVFNLNDSRWGRSDSPANGPAPGETAPPAGDPPPSAPQPPQPQAPAPAPTPSRPQGPQAGPPALDELWRDFNRKLGGMFGGSKGGNRGGFNDNRGGGNGNPPNMKNAGIGAALILGVVVLVWLSTGFFIVQEGQQAVITQFGRYQSTVGAGFNWRLPYPIQRHELVFVTQMRSVDIGRDTVNRVTGLRDSAMLTEDENIVEIKFAVQYRLNDARAWLFESKNPAEAVVQAAETAVREVLGKMKMDSALADERDQIAPRVRKLMQSIVDQYKIGVDIVAVNLQQGGVRPPEQVQSAFDEVLKAGQERERIKNEAQAYANDVIPRAAGTAARLKEEAESYKARIVAQAQGDASRFAAVLPEYQKAPQVTRDRLYLETMQDIYAKTTKVVVDSKQGSNLLYLPIDKLMAAAGRDAPTAADAAAPPASSPPTVAGGSSGAPAPDARSRDSARSRDRESR